MVRCLVAGAALVALLGSANGADLDVRPYPADPSLCSDGGGSGYYQRQPVSRPPAAPTTAQHVPFQQSNSATPAGQVSANVGAATGTTPRENPPAMKAPLASATAGVAAPVVPSAGNDVLCLLIMLGCAILSLLCFCIGYLLAEEERAKLSAGQADSGPATVRATTAPVQTTIASMTVVAPTKKETPMSTGNGNLPAEPAGFPSQGEWTQRAGKVRDPVSGFFFGIGARANARALEEEQKRMQSARAVIKEYAGMYSDLLEGEQAATAHAVRRGLAGEHYEHERAKQQEVFDEAAHGRQLAGKRRQKELTEADSRVIEAQHEQEALERFKEPKFKAGLARFEEKEKGYQVGTASADAAIAEAKAPAKPDSGANENAEVAQLYALLQAKMRAIEEGERLGQDTQGLREQVELYKKLLNLT